MLTTTKFWLWLSTQVSLVTAWRVLDQFGTPEKAYFADPEEYESIPGLSQEELQALSDKSVRQVERILEDCQRLHVRIVTWQDAAYPDRLRGIELPPLVLYFQGRPLQIDDEPVIAMAGTRRASPYGLTMARTFAREITQGGGLVLTGVAYGCDTNAIMGAFDARGSVAVVLPGGVDVPFSSSGSGVALYQDLQRYGTLISEYPPGTPNRKEHFRMRNRLLTGMAIGVLCVEAPRHSGTLQVAAYAREQDRDVFVVPARVDDISAAGTNDLMCQGFAMPIMSGRDLLGYFTAVYPQLLRQQEKPLRKVKPAATPAPEVVPEAVIAASAPDSVSEKKVDTAKSEAYIDLDSVKDSLSEQEKRILTAMGSDSVTSEELIAATGLNAADLMSTLTLLTLRSLVIPEDAGRFRSAVR